MCIRDSVNCQQLHWATAQDTPLHTDIQSLPKEELDAKRRRWLRLPHQDTAHVAGPLPLTVGMPIRLTETLDREHNLCRGRRGVLIGWAPHPKEERLNVDGEWLLSKLPIRDLRAVCRRTLDDPFTTRYGSLSHHTRITALVRKQPDETQ